jgi:hypothetical protein
MLRKHAIQVLIQVVFGEAGLCNWATGPHGERACGIGRGLVSYHLSQVVQGWITTCPCSSHWVGGSSHSGEGTDVPQDPVAATGNEKQRQQG